MTAALRRGVCPGLSAPMQTGDGLLVRLLPIGTIALNPFAKLCAAARAHGNGVVEITVRGSIQVRGLSAASAPLFAAAVAALGIAADEGIPILTNPLAGLDAEEIFDANALAAAVRLALAQTSLGARLSPKVSIVIDGGGGFDLDEASADVRVKAGATGGVAVGVGSDGASTVQLGTVAPADAVAAVKLLLEVVAQHGRDARARDIVAAEGITPFVSAVADLLAVPAPKSSCPALGRASTASLRCEAKDVDGQDKGGHNGRGSMIGFHRLGDGSFACGIGLAFGHAETSALEALVQAARHACASGMRATPGRVLITVGLTQEATHLFTDAAEKLGFIVSADDPRRRVVACAGAPICASGHIAARALAPSIAAAAAPFLDGGATIHISGCAKGCAHSAAAALTVVGTPGGCGLVADGTARDGPFAVIAAKDLPGAIAGCLHGRQREAGHV